MLYFENFHITYHYARFDVHSESASIYYCVSIQTHSIFFQHSRRCNVEARSHRITSVTITTVNKNFIYFILINTLKCLRLCFVTSRKVTLQCSDFVILLWPSFGDYIVKSSWLLHCNESPNNAQWSHIVTIRLATFIESTVKLPAALLCGKTPYDFILLLHGNLSQNNSHGDFTMEFPNESYTKHKRWIHCKVISGLVTKQQS